MVMKQKRVPPCSLTVSYFVAVPSFLLVYLLLTTSKGIQSAKGALQNREQSKKSRKKKEEQNREHKRKNKGKGRAESNRFKRNREERKLFRIERTERWTGKDITRSEDTLFSRFQSKENEKRERKKKLSDAAVVCTINNICAGVNQPQEKEVKNRNNHKVNLHIYSKCEKIRAREKLRFKHFSRSECSLPQLVVIYNLSEIESTFPVPFWNLIICSTASLCLLISPFCIFLLTRILNTLLA